MTISARDRRTRSAHGLDLRFSGLVLERSVLVARRGWISIVTEFVEPFMYLLAVEIGFSRLVREVSVGRETIDYARFVAPGLLAAAAMNGAIAETTMKVFAKMRYTGLYESVLSTPVSPTELAIAEIAWAVMRGTLYAVAFVAAMATFGMVGSAWILLAVPASMLVSAAFASLGMAVTTVMRSWVDFDYVNAATLPLLLFSATFFPRSTYGGLAWLLQLSPLYHGVALLRAANEGQWSSSCLGHGAVLVGLTCVGMWIASRRVGGLLLR